jgi:hypothetical protein
MTGGWASIALKCAKAGFQAPPPEVRNAGNQPPQCVQDFEIHTTSTAQATSISPWSSSMGDAGRPAAARRAARPEALVIALQMCAGYGSAPQAIVHGDLKSNNIIIAAEPEEVRAIAGFRLAQRRAGPQPDQSLGEAGGTRTIAPELWAGEKPSTASDIYALVFSAS